MPTYRRRLYPEDLRALARLMERGDAQGVLEMSSSYDDNFDYVGLEPGYRGGVRGRRSHDRVEIGLDVYDFISWADQLDEMRDLYVGPSGLPVKEAIGPSGLTIPIPSPPPPRPDGGPALDRLIQVVKVIVAAWASDDTTKRFRMLELD